MADVSEVADALVSTLASVFYPNGTSQSSLTGDPCLIYQGWPNAQQLAADLRSGKIHVSVFPRPGDKVTATLMGDSDWTDQTNNGTTGTAIRELRRQTRMFQITVWASCFDHRNPAAKAIDSALSAITRMTMPDGSQATMAYVNSTQDDDNQKQGIYRRDLFFNVNYATTQLNQVAYTILHTTENLTMSQSGVAGLTTTITN